MQLWFAEATRVASLEAEICFTIAEDFYFGPDRFPEPAEYAKLVQRLTPPNIERITPSLLKTSEALGREDELAAYYRQIVRLARHYRLPYNSIRHYFWLQLVLWNSEHDVHLSFPWYDSFSAIDSYLHDLSSIENGLVHHDMDQGWEMETYAEDAFLYFLQRDPDCEEMRCGVRVPRDGVVARVTELRKQTQSIILHLSVSLGADVWTAYARTEPRFHADMT
jgi:hypothetical protein